MGREQVSGVDPVMQHLKLRLRESEGERSLCFVAGCAISCSRKSEVANHFNLGWHEPGGPGATAKWDPAKVVVVSVEYWKADIGLTATKGAINDDSFRALFRARPQYTAEQIMGDENHPTRDNNWAEKRAAVGKPAGGSRAPRAARAARTPRAPRAPAPVIAPATSAIPAIDAAATAATSHCGMRLAPGIKPLDKSGKPARKWTRKAFATAGPLGGSVRLRWEREEEEAEEDDDDSEENEEEADEGDELEEEAMDAA